MAALRNHYTNNYLKVFDRATQTFVDLPPRPPGTDNCEHEVRVTQNACYRDPLSGAVVGSDPPRVRMTISGRSVFLAPVDHDPVHTLTEDDRHSIVRDSVSYHDALVWVARGEVCVMSFSRSHYRIQRAPLFPNPQIPHTTPPCGTYTNLTLHDDCLFVEFRYGSFFRPQRDTLQVSLKGLDATHLPDIPIAPVDPIDPTHQLAPTAPVAPVASVAPVAPNALRRVFKKNFNDEGRRKTEQVMVEMRKNKRDDTLNRHR